MVVQLKAPTRRQDHRKKHFYLLKLCLSILAGLEVHTTLACKLECSEVRHMALLPELLPGFYNLSRSTFRLFQKFLSLEWK